MPKIDLNDLLGELPDGERAAFFYLLERLRESPLPEISVGEIFDVLYFTRKDHAAKKNCPLFAINDYFDDDKHIPAELYNLKILLK